jgi:Serine/threonine protein kinase
MDTPEDTDKTKIKTRVAAKKPLDGEGKQTPAKTPLEAPGDATVIKRSPRPASPSPDATVVKKAAKRPLSDSDKTRIASHAQQKQRQINRALQEKGIPQAPTKTRTAARPKAQPAAGDQTKIQPKVQPKARPPAGDKTQFNPGRRTPAAAPASGGHGAPTGLSLEPGQTNPSVSASTPRKHILKNRFIFEEMLGAGGMGMVYKAKDLLKVEAQDRDPYVAIKVLGDDFKSHPEAFIALQRESRKTQKIAHPNIVNVFDFDKDGDSVFMTMEFLDGKPLDKLISQYKATGLPEEDAWRVLEGICAALMYAHGENIIHSDFKPGNIFVTGKGLAKVFDFGIARAVAATETHEDDPEDKTVFDAGNLGALTPAYASKEMLEGLEPDVRDDIYALGCIAYEMFTGRHPFDRVHANEAARLGLKPERIPQLRKNQWKALEKALAFEREGRASSVEEFWGMMTQLRQSYFKAGVVTVVILALLTTVGYLYMGGNNGPTISEDDVRSEIEMQLRVEQHRTNITSLLKTLEFTRTWEADLLLEVEELTSLVGENDEWLQARTPEIYQQYLQKITVFLQQEDMANAARLLENAPRYAGDLNALSALTEQYELTLKSIEKRLADVEERDRLAKKRATNIAVQKAEEKKKRDVFDQAMTNVTEQTSCRSGLNMRDFKIAVTKLREVDMSRYRKNEGGIVTALSACISRIGRSFPERANEYKKQAIRLFPKNNAVQSIAIIPKDPCDLSLAGLGARGKRASCRDRLAGEEKGPTLVVIPAKGSVKAFAIGKYEVTVEEYNQYCTSSGNCTANVNTNLEFPVTNISPRDVKGYLRWVSEKAKRKYRLPTRAEWEYAARAQRGKLDSNRNCKLNSRGIQKGDSLIKADVGVQNRWGLVNHVGNVRELVADRGGEIVAVGGSYQTAMEDCSVNLAETVSGADKYTGFRLLREIVER